MSPTLINKKSERFTLLLMLAVSTALFFWGNLCGIGYTFDSFLYVDIAEQINNQGFWKNEGFNFRPPAIPLLIKLLGVENMIWTNLSCLWISLILIFTWGKEISTLTLRNLFYILVILATPLYLTHSFLWTEPLFTTVLLIAFFSIHRYTKNNQTPWLACSLFAFLLLPTIRLAGTFISFPIFFWLLLFISGKGRQMVAASIVVLIGLFLLWTFNFNSILSQGSSLLSIGQFLNQLTENITSFLDGFSIWFMPHPTPLPFRLVTGVLVLGFIGFVATLRLRAKPLDSYGIIAASFLLYYLALHPYFEVTFYTAERYLTPMYALVLLALIIWIDNHYESLNQWAKKVTLIVLALQCIYGGLRVSNNLTLWNTTRCSEIYSNVLESAESDFKKRYSEIKKETFSNP